MNTNENRKLEGSMKLYDHLGEALKIALMHGLDHEYDRIDQVRDDLVGPILEGQKRTGREMDELFSLLEPKEE